MGRLKKIHDDLLLGLTGKYSWKQIFKALAIFWITYLLIQGSTTGSWAPDAVWIFLAGIVLGIEGMQEMSKKHEDRRFRHWRPWRRRDAPDDPEDPNLKNEPDEI